MNGEEQLACNYEPCLLISLSAADKKDTYERTIYLSHYLQPVIANTALITNDQFVRSKHT